MKPTGWQKTSFDERTLEFDVTPALGTGDTVASVTSVTVFYGTTEQTAMVSGSPTLTGNKVYQKIVGGTDGYDYTIRVRVVTTGGDKIENTLNMMVRD